MEANADRMKSLVVAKYKEDTLWTQLISPPKWDVKVLDKSDNLHAPWDWKLENAPGREAHTYLFEILDIWHSQYSWPEEIAFCQGNPFDHDSLFLEHLSDDSIRTYGDIYECPSDGGPHMVNANLDELCLRVGIKPRSTYRFIAGCQFRVTAGQIRQHPIEVYEFLLAYSKLGTTPHCAWTLERFLPTLFGIL